MDKERIKDLELLFSVDIDRLWKHPELETLAFMAISSAVYRFSMGNAGSETLVQCESVIGFIQDTYCDFPTSALMQTLKDYIKYTQARGLDIQLIYEDKQDQEVLRVTPSQEVSMLPSSLEASAVWAAGEVASRFYGKEASLSSLGKLFSDFSVIWELEAREPLQISIEKRETPDFLETKWDRGLESQQNKKSH